MSRKGVLLINLGTPESPTVPAVRQYLREFLSDPRVIDAPALVRWLLLNLVILPFRPKKSAAAYQEIWTDAGSPLLVHSEALAQQLAESLGSGYQVELAMRYGTPSIQQAVDRLKQADCRDWVVVPLYPQYAQSTTESSWQAVMKTVKAAYVGQQEPTLRELPPFYQDTHYIAALQQVTAEALSDQSVDHVLMSYHGLPERHLSPPICNTACDKQNQCCPAVNSDNKDCYRAHCFATSRAVAEAMCLADGEYTVSFQSRLGRIPWIGPDTEVVVDTLYQQGVRRLAVMMPAFVADCLETLEEIGLRLRKQWLAQPDTEFVLLPCLNAHSAWVRALQAMVQAV
jgi:ferrochelatase